MSPALKAHFSEYASFHVTRGNQACHYVGIPLIVLTLFTFLTRVELFEVGGLNVTLAEGVMFAVVAYYLRLDVSLGFLMLGVFAVLNVAGRPIPLAWGAALFVLGWVFQFLGHSVYEKRSPAFYKNLLHLLVGPLWITAKAVGRA
jgi:uncharacterized membrane protein YGL010W